jgi:thiol-disulfide isomerase/thioredoxin
MRTLSLTWPILFLNTLAIGTSLVLTTVVKAPAVPLSAISQNSSGRLAKELQGKPVVVDIYASWCPVCENTSPTLTQLKQEYNRKVNFVVLDVSDRSKASQAEAKAKNLGLGSFFAANKSQTGLIAIIDPATGKVLKQFRNNTDKSAYTSVLNAAITRK